jgi:5'(3')-deoxyribonucleotidase
MDGVVADWDRQADLVLQAQGHRRSPSGQYSREAWQRFRNTEHFYRNLPKTAFADMIIQKARRFRDRFGWRLYMLTAIPTDPPDHDVYQDKVLWQQEHYPDIPVRFGPRPEDKQDHCRPGDILVDDRTSNCEQWRQRGGTAIQVTQNWPQALAELEIQLTRLELAGGRRA